MCAHACDVCERESAAAATAAATRRDGRRGSGWSRLRRDANKSCCLKLNISSPRAACLERIREAGKDGSWTPANQTLVCKWKWKWRSALGDLFNHCWMTFRPLKCRRWNFHFGLDEGLPRKVIVASRLCLLLNATEQQMNVSTHHRVPPTRAPGPHANLDVCPSPLGFDHYSCFPSVLIPLRPTVAVILERQRWNKFVIFHISFETFASFLAKVDGTQAAFKVGCCKKEGKSVCL